MNEKRVGVGASRRSEIGRQGADARWGKRSAGTQVAIPEFKSACAEPADCGGEPLNDNVVVTITPELAKRWLEENPNQRPLNQARVELYAKDMKSGNWPVTWDGLSRDTAGKLINGQHRLHAVILANVAVRMRLFFNQQTKLRRFTDRGLSRSVVDDLVLDGSPRQEARHRASITRTLGVIVHGGASTISSSESTRLESVYADGLAWARKYFAKKRGELAAGVFSALVYAYRAYPQAVETCMSGLLSGANLPEGSPILALRNALLEPRTSRTLRPLFIKTLHCVEAIQKNKSVGHLKPGPAVLDRFRAFYDR